MKSQEPMVWCQFLRVKITPRITHVDDTSHITELIIQTLHIDFRGLLPNMLPNTCFWPVVGVLRDGTAVPFNKVCPLGRPSSLDANKAVDLQVINLSVDLHSRKLR